MEIGYSVDDSRHALTTIAIVAHSGRFKSRHDVAGTSAKLAGSFARLLFADISYAGIHVRTDIAICGRWHRVPIAGDDVGLVVVDQIEEFPRADFFTRGLFPFNVTTDSVDRLT